MVEWVDSYGCTAHWGGFDNIPPMAHSCYTVGWLARESDDALLIVPHISPKLKGYDDSEEQACGDMTIPKCSIIKIDELTVRHSLPSPSNPSGQPPPLGGGRSGVGCSNS